MLSYEGVYESKVLSDNFIPLLNGRNVGGGVEAAVRVRLAVPRHGNPDD